MKNEEGKNVAHRGGCHCGAVAFEVDAPATLVLHDCNCSVCRMTGFLHLIVDKSDFRLLSGSNDLVEYRFNTGVARHLFCKKCGIKSFYVPRSDPDGVSINFNCLDQAQVESYRAEQFDGRNWEAAMGGRKGLAGSD
ncbi:MAG: GFA family protein [Gammaproteobacteria bacterium]